MNSYKILIVDDEEILRELLLSFLQMVSDDRQKRGMANFDLETSENGMDAWRKIDAAKGSYDVIISDVSMPEMDGIELNKRVHGAYPEIRFIFLSGEKTPAELSGSCIFLNKPLFSLGILQSCLEKLL